MPILERLQSYLDTNQIPYEVVSHPKVYTAHDMAQTLDIARQARRQSRHGERRFVLCDDGAPINLAGGPETIAGCT